MQALLLSYQSSDTSLVGLLILVICITNILDIDVEMPNAKCRMPMPDAECRGLQMAAKNFPFHFYYVFTGTDVTDNKAFREFVLQSEISFFIS